MKTVIRKASDTCCKPLPGGFHACVRAKGHKGECKCSRHCAIGHKTVSYRITCKD